MSAFEVWLRDSLRSRLAEGSPDLTSFVAGGLFLEPAAPPSFVSSVFVRCSSVHARGLCCSGRGTVVWGVLGKGARGRRGGFLSVSLSVKEGEGFARESVALVEQNGGKLSSSSSSEELEEALEGKLQTVEKERVAVQGARAGAMNTTKHLWAGAVAAMVSRWQHGFTD